MTREQFWCDVFLRVMDRTDKSVDYKDCIDWADMSLEDYDKRFATEGILVNQPDLGKI